MHAPMALMAVKNFDGVISYMYKKLQEYKSIYITSYNADMVFIDTAPHSEEISIKTAKISDLVLIPCRPSILDLRAIISTIEICQYAKVPFIVVLNQVPPRGGLADDALKLLKELNVDYAPIQIVSRLAYVHSLTENKGILEFDKQCKASQEITQLYNFIKTKLGEI